MHIPRHEEADFGAVMRILIKAFTKCIQVSDYLVADVETVQISKDIGVHSTRVPSVVLPHLLERKPKE